MTACGTTGRLRCASSSLPRGAEHTGYITYALALFFIIGYITYRWRMHVKRKYHQMMEDFRITQDKEIYKQKISFFINLVHEIRTPLSLICLPLEKLRDGR